MIWVAAAWAHEPGLSKVDLGQDALVLQVARVDAPDPAHLLDGTVVTVGGAPCTLSAPTVVPDSNGFVATAPLSCPAGDRVRVEAGWFDQLPAGHRTVVHDGGKPVAWLDATHRTFEAARVGGIHPWRVAVLLVVAGIAAVGGLGARFWTASARRLFAAVRTRPSSGASDPIAGS